MPDINPLTNNQIFLKKIAENTGSDYETGDVSEINPLTIDQIFLKEIAANTAGQSGDITELEGKVADNTAAIEAIVNEYGAKNLYNYTYLTTQTFSDLTVTVNADKSITIVGTNNSGSDKIFYTNSVAFDIPAGSYIVNGGLDASIENDIKVLFYRGDNHEVIHNEDVPFTFDSTVGCNFTIYVANGATVNATIKPMIRDARITDPTYVPYAMTNRELTDAVNRGSVSVTADGVKTYRQLFNGLYALIDFNKVTGLSYLRVEASYLHICTVAGSYYGNASVYEGMPQIVSVFLDANDSLYDIYYSGANHDEKNTVAPSGRIFTMYY